MIAMKFGMLVIGLGENHKSIDELARTIFFFLGDPTVPCVLQLHVFKYLFSEVGPCEALQKCERLDGDNNRKYALDLSSRSRISNPSYCDLELF